jgi:polysaccharide export outer membrane protein|tara:strand:- start:3204 stop:3929 length:726 start_codon:yes stop_codon:yes gene_type:complete
MKTRLLLVLAALLASGCASNEPIRSTENLTVIEGATKLPEPTRADIVAPDRPALIGPLDTIEVDVFNVPEMRREMQVDASGRIAMPLIGTIYAGGKTAGELSRDIETELSHYIRDPGVTINIRSSVSQVVAIDGEVVEPGLYPVTNQMTLMRAVASARGLSEFAKQDDVVILRTVEGRRMAGLYNIGAIRRGIYEDPPIYANDVVVVGDSPARRRFRDIVSLAPLLAAPLISIIDQAAGSN